jgi:hypothetical protein
MMPSASSYSTVIPSSRGTVLVSREGCRSGAAGICQCPDRFQEETRAIGVCQRIHSVTSVSDFEWMGNYVYAVREGRRV